MDNVIELIGNAMDAEEFIEGFVPESVRENPWFIKYPLGTIAILGYVVAFASFTAFGYVETAGSSFISITNGSDPCNMVDRPLSGKYLAS